MVRAKGLPHSRSLTRLLTRIGLVLAISSTSLAIVAPAAGHGAR